MKCMNIHQFKVNNLKHYESAYGCCSNFVMIRFRNSHRRCSLLEGVLKMFAKLTGKHRCWSLFFDKLVGLRPAVLLKKRLRYRCFLVSFANI